MQCNPSQLEFNRRMTAIERNMQVYAQHSSSSSSRKGVVACPVAMPPQWRKEKCPANAQCDSPQCCGHILIAIKSVDNKLRNNCCRKLTTTSTNESWSQNSTFVNRIVKLQQPKSFAVVALNLLRHRESSRVALIIIISSSPLDVNDKWSSSSSTCGRQWHERGDNAQDFC